VEKGRNVHFFTEHRNQLSFSLHINLLSVFIVVCEISLL
jgi:hypothetical protein